MRSHRFVSDGDDLCQSEAIRGETSRTGVARGWGSFNGTHAQTVRPDFLGVSMAGCGADVAGGVDR